MKGVAIGLMSSTMEFVFGPAARRACAATLSCVLMTGVLVAGPAVLQPRQAAAFELFGLNLFGDDEADTQSSEDGPIAIDARLTVTGGSEDLVEALDSTASLVTAENPRAFDLLDVAARARRDRDSLIAALYGYGYYGGIVRVTIGGAPLSAFDDPFAQPISADTGVIAVVYEVEANAPFTFGDAVYVLTTGEEGGSLAPYGIISGDIAKGLTLLEAEDKLVAEYRSRGHAAVSIADRVVTADHSRRVVDVRLVVAIGPVARFGGVEVVGAERVDAAFIRQQADIPTGAPYDPDVVEGAGNRVRDLLAFDRVSVREGPVDASGAVPITIEVAERKRRFIGAGASWSSADGVELNAYWGHRNLFGRAERLRIEGRVARLADGGFDDVDYELRASFLKPGVYGPATDFHAEAYGLREEPDNYVREAVGGIAGFTREFDDMLTGSAALEVESSTITDAFGKNSYLLISTPLELVYDARDDRLNPTSGFRALVNVTPTFDTNNSVGFVSISGALSGYAAIDDDKRFVLAGRVAAGSILGANLAAVPADRRFFLGGGGSIRGYAYRNVGPRLANGAVTGGLSFVEASAEARIGVTETIGIVPFVDMGAVAASEDFSNLQDPSVGVGVGVRLLTPVGPLRVDVAVPLDPQSGDPDVGFYAGLGQAF